MSRILRWIGSLLAIGTDSRPLPSHEEALYEIRHRSARYY